jgi:hypothetical protein
MAQCNILEALRYVEDLYKNAPNDKANAANKKALRSLFQDVNEQRAYLQQIATFAGVKALDPTKPRSKDGPEVIVPVKDDLPPWMADPDTFLENIKKSYGKFGRTLVEFIKSKKQVNIKMDKLLAIKILRNESDNFAEQIVERANSSLIRYPDFDAVLNDEGALANIAKANKISIEDAKILVEGYKQSGYLQMTKVHEHIHVGAVEFMAKNPKDPKTKYVNNLFKKVVAMADGDRPSLNDIQDGYWKTNVDEFIAVALSNPELMAFLNDMPATGFTSTLHKLVNTLAEMVGIRQGSENEALLNIFLQMTEATLDEEAQVDTPNQLGLFQGIPLGELSAIISEVNKCKSKG